jgi:hypothetical protein
MVALVAVFTGQGRGAREHAPHVRAGRPSRKLAGGAFVAAWTKRTNQDPFAQACPAQAHYSLNEIHGMRSANTAGLLVAEQRSNPAAQVPPNPSIEGTSYGLRPPAAPHVKR